SPSEATQCFADRQTSRPTSPKHRVTSVAGSGTTAVATISSIVAVAVWRALPAPRRMVGMSEAPSPRFRFTLRTLFAGVTAAAFALACCLYLPVPDEFWSSYNWLEYRPPTAAESEKRIWKLAGTLLFALVASIAFRRMHNIGRRR